jgi:SCY1-like protein 2
MFSKALSSWSSNISSNYKTADQSAQFIGPWKVSDAKHKTNGKAVSVWVFDKKSLEPTSSGFGRSGGGSLKKLHEELVERLKREASLLARLRHPNVLELAEPVEDTRNGGLIFATEPVTTSLASLLIEKDDQERSRGSSRAPAVDLDELDMQKGLLQIAKGLDFLHTSAQLVHGNLTPEVIVVNAKGDWKISGFAFSGKPDDADTSTAPPIPLSEVLNHDSRLPQTVQLNIDYTSPDFILDNSVTTAADMFSLGLLVIALYRTPHKSPLETHQSLSSYKRMFSSSSSVPTQNNNFLTSTKLDPSVSALLSRLITRRPAQRASAKEFQEATYFDNILVSTIRFLESLPAKTPSEKSAFLRGLPRIMPQFSAKVLERKVLPALLDEMKDKDLISLILQNIFKMLKTLPSSKRAFPEKIVPRLREIFLGTDKKPATERDSAKEAGLMVLLENIRQVSDNTTGKEFKDDILPIIFLAVESPTHSLVDAALGTLPTILSSLDFTTIKNEVFPVISSVFTKTSSLGIKIRGLEALKILCGGGNPAADDNDELQDFGKPAAKPKMTSVILDKYTIQEKVVPLLKGIKTKEPAVMMAALDVFQEIGKTADYEFMATDGEHPLFSFH